MLDLLLDTYPRHYNCSLQLNPEQIQSATTISPSFELCDTIRNGLAPKGNGEAVFQNPHRQEIIIIDIEAYFGVYPPSHPAGKGKKCDFILCKSAGEETRFVCLELTRSLFHYIESHKCDGKEVEGKRAKAYVQLADTINKLIAVPEIIERIDTFHYRQAIFGYRLNDSADSNNPVGEMNKAFNRFDESVPTLKSTDQLPGGFIFSQQKYPNPIVL